MAKDSEMETMKSMRDLIWGGKEVRFSLWEVYESSWLAQVGILGSLGV